jgi:hypothetical protein
VIAEQDEETKPVDDQVVWEEKAEKITPEHMALFTREFIAELADKIAVRLVSKLDSDKLHELIVAELIGRSRPSPEK